MVEWNHQPGEGLEDPKFLQLKHREVDKCNSDSHREHDTTSIMASIYIRARI